MTAMPHSTIGQMLYARRPPLVLTQLVSDLDRALAALTAPSCQLSWEDAHTAIFDFDGGRIIVAYEDNPCDPWQACLTITVGDGETRALGRLARRHSTLAHKIVEDIARHHPPDSVRWLAMPARMDRDILSELSAQLEYAAETQAALGQSTDTDRARRLLPTLDSGLVEATDARLCTALAEMRQAQEETEAQFARKHRHPALALWARLTGWITFVPTGGHPSEPIFPHTAKLRRIG